MKTRRILGQESWSMAAPRVEAALTRQGGHLGPIRFRLGQRWVEPYDIAPWAEEKLPASTPGVLRSMRGDFFCMPFGGTEPFRGENHPPHGEPANAAWQHESSTGLTHHFSQQTTVRKGRVDKILHFDPEHAAVYSRHIISGIKGPMTFGHHPILKLEQDSQARISLSRFREGQVIARRLEDPAQGGYSILKPGAKFKSLNRVPQMDGGTADLSIYPAREGYEDIVLIGADETLPWAWTTMVRPKEGYVWFSLKDPRVLRSTVFWMSNGGRHYAPWNGRHRAAIGLEEVTGYFHYGIGEASRPNSLNRAGIVTSFTLSPKAPLTVNFIMAVAEIPKGFDIVKTITSAPTGNGVVLTSRSGKKVFAPVDVSFLFTQAIGGGFASAAQEHPYSTNATARIGEPFPS